MTRQSHTRETLAALLWPETAPGRAYANLRQILWELNQALDEGWLQANHDTVSLNLDAGLWLDIAQFRLLLTSLGKLERDCDRCVPLLTEAAALYQDHFLAGFSLKEAPGFDEWVFFEAEGLRRDLARSLETLVHCLCAQGQAEAAIPHARRLVALDPVHEETHRQLMKVYEQADQHHAALRQYQECVRLMRDELGVEPEPQTTALYEEIRAGALATRLVSSTPLLDTVDKESSAELRNPYKGLRAFQEADAP